MSDQMLRGICRHHRLLARLFPRLYRIVQSLDDDLLWTAVMTRPSLRGGVLVVCVGGDTRTEP